MILYASDIWLPHLNVHGIRNLKAIQQTAQLDLVETYMSISMRRTKHIDLYRIDRYPNWK